MPDRATATVPLLPAVNRIPDILTILRIVPPSISSKKSRIVSLQGILKEPGHSFTISRHRVIP